MSTIGLASLLLGAYSHFLPPGKEGERLIQVMSEIDFSIEAQERLSSVTFMSGESKSDLGYPVINRVSLIEKSGFDMWLMRQYISPKKVLPKKLPDWWNWSFVGILVDKTKLPKKAYYFEFEPKNFPAGILPELTEFRASCSNCHASGPRLIRPSTAKLGEFQLKESMPGLLKDWNKKIENYREVEDYLSNHEAKMFPADPIISEVLTHTECSECHNNTNQAVRGPLRRKHGESILFLVTNLEMPMDLQIDKQVNHSQLILESKKRYSCLKEWLEVESSSSQKRTSTNYKKHSPQERLDQCFDESNSSYNKVRKKEKSNTSRDKNLKSKLPLKTSLDSKLIIEHFSMSTIVPLSAGLELKIVGLKLKSFDFECELPSLCVVTGKIDLDQVSTGIKLRDRHLNDWLNRNQAKTWIFRLDLAPLVNHNLGQKNRIDLSSSFTKSLSLQFNPDSLQPERYVSTLLMSCQKKDNPSASQLEGALIKKPNDLSDLKCSFQLPNVNINIIKNDQPCFLGVCVLPQVSIFGNFAISLPNI